MSTGIYRAPMTDFQREFFQALCQPFHPSDIEELSKGGRSFSWIKSYAMMNRLDEVAGPYGWTVEYTTTERGQKCRLGIYVPVGEDPETGLPEFDWRYREDGGGDAGMPSDEDDEKSGYTDSFKRACMAWGINRPLWQCGAPDWMHGVPVQEMPYGRGNGRPAPRQQQRPPQGPPSNNSAPASNGATTRPSNSSSRSTNGQYDNFKIPKAGKPIYAWAKNMEKHYGQTVVPGIRKYAENQGWGTDICALDQTQVNESCKKVIDYFKTLDNYGGEYDSVEYPESPNQPPPGMNALRGKVWEAAGRIAVMIHDGDGQPSDSDRFHVVKTAWSEVHPDGVVLQSLKGCTDFDGLQVTLAHMEKYEKIKREQMTAPAAAAEEIDDDIPF